MKYLGGAGEITSSLSFLKLSVVPMADTNTSAEEEDERLQRVHYFILPSEYEFHALTGLLPLVSPYSY